MTLIKKGNPTRKSGLIQSVLKELAGVGYLSKNSIHGADASFCSRKATLHLALPKNSTYKMESSSGLYFAIGNSIHDRIAKALGSAKLLVANEFPVELHGIKGYIDNIVISDDTGGLKIIDIKTCGKLPTAIKVGQAEQIFTYVIISGITEASVLYVSRLVANYEGVLISELPVAINTGTLAKHALIMAESIIYKNNKIVPDRPSYHTVPEGCGWCQFRNNGCFSDSEGILELSNGFRYENTTSLDHLIKDLAIELVETMPARREHFIRELEKSPKTIRPAFEKVIK